MSSGLFLDTSFVQAMLNRKDEHHARAMSLAARLRMDTIWTTEAIITEIGNALSTFNRAAAAQFIRSLYLTQNVRVVTVTTDLLQRSLKLYEARTDKDWGLTDCISFVTMEDNALKEALSADRHFLQAGYRALLLDHA